MQKMHLIQSARKKKYFKNFDKPFEENWKSRFQHFLLRIIRIIHTACTHVEGMVTVSFEMRLLKSTKINLTVYS